MVAKVVKLLVGVLSLYAIILEAEGVKCDRLSSCSCECPDGVIDLEPLANKNGQPKYKDQAAPDTYKYSYNPCFGFKETAVGTAIDYCQDVAACQVINLSNVYQFYDIGTQASASFETRMATDVGIQEEGEVVVVSYTAADGGRQSEVVLVCNSIDDSTTIAVIGELPLATPTYRFIMISPDACFIPNGISAGSIMIIVFFSGAAVYLLVGLAYKKFIAKASGRELIPNADLWFSLPGLIKDGVLFPIRRNGYTTM